MCYEAVFYRHYNDDVNVHVLYVHVYLHACFRYVLHSKGETHYCIILCGLYDAYYRETSSEPPGFYFFRKEKESMIMIFERLVRANYRFGRMCRNNAHRIF